MPYSNCSLLNSQVLLVGKFSGIFHSIKKMNCFVCYQTDLKQWEFYYIDQIHKHLFEMGECSAGR